MVADEAMREFLIESHENLDQLDRDFLALESDPTQRDRLAAIFRTIHTIKGTCGFLALNRLGLLAHSGESLLSMLRDGVLTLSPAITTTLLEMVDRIRGMLRDIEAQGTESAGNDQDLIARLDALRANGAARLTGALPLAVVSATPAARNTAATLLAAGGAAPATRPPTGPMGVRTIGPAGKAANTPGEGVRLAPTPAPKNQTGSNRLPSAATSGQQATGATHPQGAAAEGGGVSDSAVRVDVGLLDKLMNLVGELVLARNQMVQFGQVVEDPAFGGAVQRLNLITSELQEHVMKTRMQPIGNVWSKLPRVVRDLAVACGKQVRVEMVGKATELDRTILEAIKDPLTHMVRNSVDHGLEAPDVRAARGKPKTGALTLRAFHEGGKVNIEIADDGNGLNLTAIRAKAVQKGLVPAEKAAAMSDREAMQMVFLPGFSTAEKITNVSGRGVGMDVVKTNIEKIGGTVELISREGLGTTIRIRIPLTLAIVPALVVVSGEQRYAIPQVNLLELVRLDSEGSQKVERIHGAPVYRLRGKLLPLVFLNEQLSGKPAAGSQGSGTNIVVLQADERRFGLVVDEVRDTEEIVVKPLSAQLKGITMFAGSTIMGDGRVALILDVMGLAQHAGALGAGRERTLAERRPSSAAAESGGAAAEKQALLLFGVGTQGTMALPLSMVARLEELPRSRLERAGRRLVAQYRGEILPLVDLAELLGVPTDSHDDGPLHVIVFSEQGRSTGIVVGRILDVVEEAIRVDRSNAPSGVLGAAIIQGRVTDLLDVEGIMRVQAPSMFERSAA